MNLASLCNKIVVLKTFSANRQFTQFSNKIVESMPKKSSGGKGQAVQHGNVPNEKCPISQNKEGQWSIAIQVKPGAKTNGITGISEDAVSIQIAAPPVDGEANIAIVKYFAEILNLKKTDVSLKGGKSRQKTVFIDGSTGLTADKIMDTLKNQKD